MSAAELEFSPNDLTRPDYPLLPHLPGTLFSGQETYTSILERLLQKRTEIQVLDLGCGSGIWAEKQALRTGVKSFGISAKDYRRRESRQRLIPIGHDSFTGKPMFESVSGVILIGDDYIHDVNLDDDSYLVGDAHDILPRLPSNFFHIIVSYQTCRYLFDPLHILKQIHRILIPSGYALLESFQPIIRNPDETPTRPQTIQRYLRRQGHQVLYGDYWPDDLHGKFGLAIKKNRPKLFLPVSYGKIVRTDTILHLQTDTISYYWQET